MVKFMKSMGSLTRGLEVVEYTAVSSNARESHENVGTNVDSWSIRQPLEFGRITFSTFCNGSNVDVSMAIACGNTFVLKPL